MTTQPYVNGFGEVTNASDAHRYYTTCSHCDFELRFAIDWFRLPFLEHNLLAIFRTTIHMG